MDANEEGFTLPRPADIRRSVGETVLVERTRRRITQRQLAEQMVALGYLEWRQRTVSDIESGRRKTGQRAVQAEELFGLALVFGMSPSDLLAECLRCNAMKSPR